jgi:hypothetical protein
MENEMFSTYLICSSSGFFYIPVKVFGGNLRAGYENVPVLYAALYCVSPNIYGNGRHLIIRSNLEVKRYDVGGVY